MNENIGSIAELRIICLLAPEGADELTISKGWGSQNVIGLEQYKLIKKFSGYSSVCLYDKSVPASDNDVLLIMKCLPGTSLDILSKYKRIIYYFDDMNPRKANEESYKGELSKVLAYISPLKSVAEEMNKQKLISSFHLPWSMLDVDFDISKTEKTSVFIDMDERNIAIESIERGFTFAELCLRLGLEVYVFDRFSEKCPEELRNQISYIPRMPPAQFRRFLSTMWFYASGIRGSYEYCVLESAMLGCGLVSIHSAIKEDHLDRCFCLQFNEQEGFERNFIEAISSFDKDKIISDARRLYPQNSSLGLKQILDEVLSFESDNEKP